MNFININGGLLEGGGQLFRNTAALSVLLCKPVIIDNIRAGRDKPGLRPQHLTGLQILSKISCGQLEGASVGSSRVQFIPGSINGGNYNADTGTAGSVVLLIQASLPCQLFANGATELRLIGGTNAEMAPQIDYLVDVFQPMARRFGFDFVCNIIRRGYYPKGGGEVRCSCQPVRQLQAVELTDRGPVVAIRGQAFVAGELPIKIAQRMSAQASKVLQAAYPNLTISIDAVKETNATGSGSGINIVAETATNCLLAGSALGRKSLVAEDVGRIAAEQLLTELSHEGCVDAYLQDQFIIFMALAKGRSRIKCGPLTLHTETAIHIASQLTEAKFNIERLSENSNIIECEGIGLENQLWLQ